MRTQALWFKFQYFNILPNLPTNKRLELKFEPYLILPQFFTSSKNDNIP